MDQGIWDIAIKINQQNIKNDDNSSNKQKETTLIFAGSKGGGKTTLIHRLLERDEAAKQTLALEYTFGRKTNQNLTKDVCHIWELGGGTHYTNLLETPLSPAALRKCTLILIIDLSQPNRIWTILTTLLSSIQEYIAAALRSQKSSSLGVQEYLDKEHDVLLEADHPDKQKIQGFPIPLVIIGSKYDIFQDFEPERKKAVCRALRYLAHTNRASLQFYSSKDPGLVKKARDLLSYRAFGMEAGKGVSQDYNKPLIIPFGSDSYESIFVSQDVPSAQVVKHQFSTMFPLEGDEDNNGINKAEDPAKDSNFKEPEIDQLRAQKDDDLERYRKDLDRKKRNFMDFEE